MINKLTKSEEDVLEYFFVNPSEEIHIRGLAKKTKMKYSSVRNALKVLNKKEILKKREEAKMSFFSANTESKYFIKLKKLHNISYIYESGLADFLEEKFKPDSMVLFGSFFNGTDHEKSDIDIAIMHGRDVSVNLEHFEKSLTRKINILHIKNIKKEKPELRNTLANGYVLKGYLVVV